MGIKSAIATGVAGVLITLAGTVALSSGTGSSCGGSTIDATAAGDVDAVAGFSGDQLTNAAAIMNAATAMGLTTQAQTIGVMTAIGESSLRNITYGDDIQGVTNPDGTPTSSIGLFQQQKWWGTTAQRMDPQQSATLFFERLAALPGWETMTPTAAAHAIQRNADPDHYTPYFKPAVDIVQALMGTAGGGDCAVSSDAQALAQEIVVALDEGRLRGGVPDHMNQIRWMARGEQRADCGINIGILQVISIAIRTFETVAISDINRQCTGQRPGAGNASWHVRDGGGHAVDFYRFNGLQATGADGQSLRLLALLDPVMPEGSHVGQKECRTGARAMTLVNFDEVYDPCTHLHIDVGGVNKPLKIGPTAAIDT